MKYPKIKIAKIHVIGVSNCFIILYFFILIENLETNQIFEISVTVCDYLEEYGSGTEVSGEFFINSFP